MPVSDSQGAILKVRNPGFWEIQIFAFLIFFDLFWRFGASGLRKSVSSTPKTSESDPETPKLIKKGQFLIKFGPQTNGQAPYGACGMFGVFLFLYFCNRSGLRGSSSKSRSTRIEKVQKRRDGAEQSS